MEMEKANRIFVGIYPTGVVYSDRQAEQYGDYKRLAFLPYNNLTLELQSDCPFELKDIIIKNAKLIQDERGKKFMVSACQQYVILGD